MDNKSKDIKVPLLNFESGNKVEIDQTPIVEKNEPAANDKLKGIMQNPTKCTSI